jgi:hypothetical protein
MFTCVSWLTWISLGPLLCDRTGHASIHQSSNLGCQHVEMCARRPPGLSGNRNIRCSDHTARPRRPRRVSKVRKLYDPRCRLGPWLGNVAVRRVRGCSHRLVLEADPCLLLPRHSTLDHAQRYQDQGLDRLRQRQQPAGLPASGLTVRDTAGRRYAVPTGAKYTSWRISRSGAGYRLSYRTSSGRYVTKSTGLTTGPWSFSTNSKIVKYCQAVRCMPTAAPWR